MTIFRKKFIPAGTVLALLLFLAFAITLTAGQTLESGDPFGAPPKGTSPNCGPENRLTLDIVVSSKDEFIVILRNIESHVRDNEIRQWLKFDNFRKTGSEEIDWEALEEAIEISTIADRTIYSVDYTPHGCSPSQKFTIKITNDGHMSLYGCCGK